MHVLPVFQRFTYSGLESSLVCDVVHGGHFEHRLLSAGHATLEHQRLVLDGVLLESGAYDFPVVARGVMPRETVCIGLVAEGAEVARCNTTPICDDEVQIYTNGVDLLYHAAGMSRWINFGIPEARLQEAAIACIGHPIDLPKKDAVWVQLSRGRRSALIRLADDAFAIGRTFEKTGISPMLATAISRGLVSSYVDALYEADIAGGRRKPNPAARQHFHLLLACERIAMSDEAREMDLADIAQRSGYSRRALELIFNRTLGMPPGRWFMNIRLNGALCELLTATPECHVGDIALRWGFRHLARFAEQYRRAFGELPSQTLYRARA